MKFLKLIQCGKFNHQEEVIQCLGKFINTLITIVVQEYLCSKIRPQAIKQIFTQEVFICVRITKLKTTELKQ